MNNATTRKHRRNLGNVSKSVAQRWMRLKMMRKSHAIARMIARARLPRLERKNRQVSEQTFETMKYYAIRTEGGRFPALATLFNIGLYLMLAHRDIQALKINALTHSDEWTRKLHARMILLTIYEWDADSVSGKALRDALTLIEAPEELTAEAYAALRQLRKIQEKTTKQFSVLRNSAIGHRDPNALLQYRVIRDLKTSDVWAIAAEFFAGVEAFISVLTKITALSGTLPSLLQQWTSSSAEAEDPANKGYPEQSAALRV